MVSHLQLSTGFTLIILEFILQDLDKSFSIVQPFPGPYPSSSKDWHPCFARYVFIVTRHHQPTAVRLETSWAARLLWPSIRCSSLPISQFHPNFLDGLDSPTTEVPYSPFHDNLRVYGHSPPGLGTSPAPLSPRSESILLQWSIILWRSCLSIGFWRILLVQVSVVELWVCC